MNKLIGLSSPFATLMLSACASQAPQAPLPPAPTCNSVAQCDFKWAAARTFVLSHSGFKFQTYTADFMETYSPVNGAVELGARVNKEPQPDGSFKITASFWCDNFLGCSPPSRQTLIEFIQAVSAAEPKTQ